MDQKRLIYDGSTFYFVYMLSSRTIKKRVVHCGFAEFCKEHQLMRFFESSMLNGLLYINY